MLTSQVRAHQEEFALFYFVAVSFSHETCSVITPHHMAVEVFHNNFKRIFFLRISCSFESELTGQTSCYGALLFTFSKFYKRNITVQLCNKESVLWII